MIVIARKVGQLGNRLLLFAHFIACAREYDVRIVNPAFDEFAKYFRGTNDDWLCRYPAVASGRRIGSWLRRSSYLLIYLTTRVLAALGLKRVPFNIVRLRMGDKCDLQSAEFIGLVKSRRPVFVQGWEFRNDTGFRRHAAAIREHFRPIEAHEKNVSRVVRRARQGGDVLVGVHFRHGDYERFQDGKYFYTTAQYVEIMQRIVQLLRPRRATFLVCSNTTQDETAFAGHRVVFGTGHVVEDLYALAECDYIVGPPSTYTMWASFYGEVPLCIVERLNEVVSLDRFTVWNEDVRVATKKTA